MSLSPGTRLGAYEIVRLIGAGGMGEVYRARDTRLGRVVAIKVLPEESVSDADRCRRFEREARAIAALNPPHICNLYDIGEASSLDAGFAHPGAVRFLVMEHINGQTLSERLVSGALSLSEVLRYAIEIADALDHAHRHGLVHRDLKPGNVMLTDSGAKLLDFGVATSRPVLDLPRLKTLSSSDAQLTAHGAVLGTFPYMAPEQLEGREADARTDIFAFGATVYEMATGERAFQGEATATLIGAILHTNPPPVSGLQPEASAAFDRIVSRCLTKDPDDRWQTARDLFLELKALAAADSATTVRQPIRARGVLAATAVLAALGICAGMVYSIGYVRSGASRDAAVRLAFSPPAGVKAADLVIGGPVTISPDGERLVFVATGGDGRQLIWVRSLESLAAQPLPGTEGGAHPFWSPDGQSVGFFAQRKLKIVHLSGSAPQTVCDAVLPRGGAWNRDGVIVYSAGAGRQLFRVPVTGGVPVAIAADGLNPERHWPSFLPDGRHFVYFGRPRKHGIYVAALDSPGARLLLADFVGAIYAPPGHLLVLRGSSRGAPAGTLLAYPFDSARIQITGEPVSVAERIRYESGLARGAFTVSETGTLVYGDIDRSSTHLVWFDREGTRIGSVGGALAFGQPALSPDQRTVAVEHVDPITQDQDLWLIDLVRNVPSRFTSQGNNITFMPIWSPDGERIAFASARGTPPNLYQKASIGTGTEQLLLESASNSQPTDWSGAAQAIVFAAMDPQTQWDLWTMPMSGAGEQRPTLLLRTEFNEHLGRVSPDGRWLAYVSDESGANEVYVRPLARPGPKKRISANGANEPKWRGDGRELFYLAADGRVLAVAVHDGTSFEFGSPAPLFQVRTGPTRNFGYDVNYAVTRDGQRFVIRELAEDSEAASATTVVLNWRAGLGQR